MTDYLERNRRTWDRWTEVNYASDFYDVEAFKEGRSSRSGLDALEAQLLGDVRGKSLLHLQCHFGLDSLALARRGASVVGVDFSAAAIAKARELSRELEIDASFIESDLYDLPEALERRFDLVFTSHGVLPWLPDLAGWAAIVARYLRPGGRFVMIEAHPFALVLDEDAEAPILRARYPYFASETPLRFEQQEGIYSDPEAKLGTVTYEWQHPLSEILQSLLDAGLRLETFAEYPFLAWPLLPWMRQREDGCWMLPDGDERMPLMFSLTASRGEST